MLRMTILMTALMFCFCASAAWGQECGGPGAGDCCASNKTPYCDDEACCEQICAEDPFCCDFEWDALCANAAVDECAICGPPPQECGDENAGDCCEANFTPYCDDEECCELICATDPFCCNASWDGVCATQANAQCEVCDPEPTPACVDAQHDCCSSHPQVGCNDGPCCELVCALDAFCCNDQWDGICAGIASDNCPVCAIPYLQINADQSCYTGGVGDEVIITIDLGGDGFNTIVGGQFFLTYDVTALEFQGAEPGSEVDPASPFSMQIHEVQMPGIIEYAVGIDPAENEGTTGNATMAVLNFTVAQDNLCVVEDAIEFVEAGQFSNLLSDEFGGPVIPQLFDLRPFTIDSESPDLADVPPDMTVPADAGNCNAIVSLTPPTADDNCDDAPVITAERDDDEPLDAPFPTGDTVITWTATDACGNEASAQTTVTVEDFSLMAVEVELQPTVASPLERCITFELFDLDAGDWIEVERDITFTDGAAVTTIEVPCGNYDECFQARDELHTLRSTGTLEIVGTEYESFIADELIGGDLNDDGVVDILDFGIFVFQFSESNPQTGDSPCGTLYPHADISGDGGVGTGDFGFIQINFLSVDETCPISAMTGHHGGGALPHAQPRERISVRELHEMGLGHLEVADLTGDGWVGPQDIAAFAAGVRP